MAVQNTKKIVCDVTGKSGADKVTFSVNGERYMIDLTPAAQKEFLTDALAPLIAKARKVGASGGTSSSENSLIREWAAQNGHTVAPVGRISAEVQQAYAKAQAATQEG